MLCPGGHFLSKGAGILLTRSRTGDITVIVVYCDGSAVLDEALAE